MIRLTREREALQWTKAQLARAAKLDQGLVSKIESGRVVPYSVELERIVAALGWRPEEAHRLLEVLDPISKPTDGTR